MTDISLAGCNVVVTGGRGFLGRHVARALSARGAAVQAVGRRDYDLTQQDDVRRLVHELRPSVLVHAGAAVGGIGANVANPGKFLYQNAVMGLMLLEEARLANVDKIVLISTTCAYPQDAPLPLREDDMWSGPPTGATGPYGMAKRLLHEACATYARQYGTQSAVLVLANLYGPEDNFEPETGHVIPALIRRYVEATEGNVPALTNWGSGHATREFLHVADAAEAVVLAVATPTESHPINIGTGVETSIRELATIVGDAVRYEGDVRWDTSKPDGQPQRYLDVTRAGEELGFTAHVPLSAGIKETVDWYMTNR
jgi:GDP-L-fucose synthase